MKTNELTGAALDWAVAKCEGWEYDDPETPSRDDRNYKPSINWKQGGPIIEREHFAIDYYPDGGHPDGGEWLVTSPAYETDAGIPLHQGFGPTPLIAAMRCYVASKLGDEVDVPKELTCS